MWFKNEVFPNLFTEIKDLLIDGDKVEVDNKVYELEQLVQRIKLFAKREAMDEIKSNLNDLIEFIKNTEPYIGRQSKSSFIDRINKLIELSEQFNR